MTETTYNTLMYYWREYGVGGLDRCIGPDTTDLPIEVKQAWANYKAAEAILDAVMRGLPRPETEG